MMRSPPITAGARLSAAVAAILLAASLFLLPPFSKAHAMKIQEVKSPAGITAWLVEEHSVPLIAMRFAFEGEGNKPDQAIEREGD